KRRIRDITQRVKGVSMKTTMEELAPYMRGWRNFFGFCETPEVLVALTRWVRLRLRAALWRQWKTPRRRRAAWAVVQYGRQRPWPMVHRPEQSPLTGAFQCILQIARSPLLVRSLLAQLLEPPRYGPVCQVVWEGRSREAPPYPDLNDRERRIFEARRLADDAITLEDLASEFGISRERVRQIEVRAFQKVQRAG